MRFLANENIPAASVRALRAADHDVVAAGEVHQGAQDPEILAAASRESRVLLTFDRDYGELIYRRGLPAPAGLIYLRFAPTHPLEGAEVILRLCEVPGLALEGKYTVVDLSRIRQRPLPSEEAR
jgi:predicted nuclease of predicted toxin-antitoxin system